MKKIAIPITLIMIAAVSATEAGAQEGRNARFAYAPNIWKVEQPRVPHAGVSGPPHSVQHGSMPKSTSFLGVDPNMLTRPQPQAVAQRPAPQPVSVAKVNSQAQVPRTTPSFSPNFGRPLTAQPTPVASLPQPVAPRMPVAAQAAPAQHAAPAKVARHSTGHRRRSTTQVAGKLVKPPSNKGLAAEPASYGKNFGYVPGGALPSQTGYSGNGRGEVHGKVLPRGTHR